MTDRRAVFDPLICVVDFHHARGPEVERWFGLETRRDPNIDNDWSLLPFLALSDGAHTSKEELSYFTLRYNDPQNKPSSLFGISCTRQASAQELVYRSPEVTRSSVQKAIVAIVDSPFLFARIREQLAAITDAWFEQKDFRDVALIEVFQESLVHICANKEDEHDHYVGLSLRDMIHEYKQQILILFKCCLLQPRMLFFGSQCEKMCLLQFSLISLIPGLLRNLQDCSDPELNRYEESKVIPTSLRTSERASLLLYMGLPLQIFGKGSLFGPYTPLQLLDVLGNADTKSYIAGSTNSLVLQQKNKYSDVLINLDEKKFDITIPSLKSALQLTASDKRWMDYLIQTVNETWDSQNPAVPTTHAYTGSEEFIRLQFEEYLLALLACVKYRVYAETHSREFKEVHLEVYKSPANDFGLEWMDAWMKTDNFRIFNRFTDSNLFDIVEPRHPCAGGISIEDFQRRVAQQVTDLHLDERFNAGREVIGKGLAIGQKKVSYAFTTLWADIEELRETQRKKFEDRRISASEKVVLSQDPDALTTVKTPKNPELSQAQAQVQAASARAGAYLSSWGSWASEKRKSGWGRGPVSDATPSTSTSESLARTSINTTTATRPLELKDEEDVVAPEKGVRAEAGGRSR